MIVTAQNRQPKGVPTGGRFAEKSHAEADVSLVDPADDLDSKTNRLNLLNDRWARHGSEMEGAERQELLDEIDSLSTDLYGRPPERATARGIAAALAELDGDRPVTEDELRQMFREVWSVEKYGPPPEVVRNPEPPPRSVDHEEFAAGITAAFPKATHVKFHQAAFGGPVTIKRINSGPTVLAVGPGLEGFDFDFDNNPNAVVMDPEMHRRLGLDLSRVINSGWHTSPITGGIIDVANRSDR